MTSIGVVVWSYYLKMRQNKSLEQFLQKTIALCAPLSTRLKNAKLTSVVEAAGGFFLGVTVATAVTTYYVMILMLLLIRFFLRGYCWRCKALL